MITITTQVLTNIKNRPFCAKTVFLRNKTKKLSPHIVRITYICLL